MKHNDTLILKVKQKVIECGDCWDWKGYCTATGVPMMRLNGERLSVRRAMLDPEFLANLTNADVVTVTCLNHKCVNPDHLVVMTRAAFLARNSQHTNHQLRLAKIAETHRNGPGAKLNYELVAEIMQSNETNMALAERLGCDHTLVSLVRRGKAWKQYGANPFSGLQSSQKVAARGMA